MRRPPAIDDPHRFGRRGEAGDVAQRKSVVWPAGVLGNAYVAGGHVGQVLEHPQREISAIAASPQRL